MELGVEMVEVTAHYSPLQSSLLWTEEINIWILDLRPLLTREIIRKILKIKFNQIVYINFTILILTHKFVTIHFPIFLHWCLFCSSLRLSWDNWDDNDGEDGDEGEVADREAGTEEAELLGLSDQSPVSL